MVEYSLPILNVYLRGSAIIGYSGPMTVGVYGLGRFGSFWSSLLAQRFAVIAYDRDGDRRPPEGVRRVPVDELAQAPVVFLCVTIRALPEVLKSLGPLLGSDTLVVDTCSVKLFPLRWMEEYLPPNTPLLATHPMFGPESAKDGLDGLSIMLDPVRLDRDRFQFWEDTFAAFGLTPVRMTCDQHDREAAYSQALTHFVGRSLAPLGLVDTPIATRWYKKLHTVVKQCVRDSHELFEDMQKYNPYAAQMRQEVFQAMVETMNTLGDDWQGPLRNFGGLNDRRSE